MTMESDANFEEKQTFGFEKDMRNLLNFCQTIEEFQNWDFDEILFPKYKMYEIKIYEEVTCYDREEWSKIWRGTD